MKKVWSAKSIAHKIASFSPPELIKKEFDASSEGQTSRQWALLEKWNFVYNFSGSERSFCAVVGGWCLVIINIYPF